MSKEIKWTPDKEEIQSGQEGYIRYLGGVAIINEPDSQFATSLHHYAHPEQNANTVLTLAEQMMVDGLKSVILFSNPPHERHMFRTEARYKQALPVMRSIINTTFAKHGERLNQINPALRILRPAPFTNEVIYGFIAHGRHGKIRTERLLDVFPPADIFVDLLEDRTLKGITTNIVRINSMTRQRS